MNEASPLLLIQPCSQARVLRNGLLPCFPGLNLRRVFPWEHKHGLQAAQRLAVFSGPLNTAAHHASPSVGLRMDAAWSRRSPQGPCLCTHFHASHFPGWLSWSRSLPALCSVTSCWWLDISHGGNIYTMGMGKCYQSGRCCCCCDESQFTAPGHQIPRWLPWALAARLWPQLAEAPPFQVSSLPTLSTSASPSPSSAFSLHLTTPPPALSHKLMSAYDPVFSLPFHEHVAKYSQSDPAVCLISNNLPQRQPGTSDSQCQSCKREELIGPDQVSAHPWSSQLLRAAERWVLIGPRRPSRGEAGLRKGRWGLEEHRGCHPTCLPRRTHSEAG